jgi:glycosyltransferase involved in cell wall biosynthesis
MVAPAGQGGTIQYAHNVCDALSVAGHQVVLATAIDCEMEPFPRRYQLLGVFDRLRPRLGPLFRFARLIRQMKPEIVHLQGAQRPEFYWLLLGILSRLCKAQFVWTPQDVVSNSTKPYHLWMQRRNYARMSHVFLNAKQNEAVLSEMYEVPPSQITVMAIPDLLDFARRDLTRTLPPELNWTPDNAPLILCFGLIEPRKGIAQLIQAFGRIVKSSDARLLIIGKPLTDIEPYKAALSGLGIPRDRAQLIARYASFEEMNGLFEAASVVVLPYLKGWNSGVLASAFGFGKPVVATRVGGFDEVIQDGKTGLLVPPDDVDALALGLQRILDDRPLRKKLQKGAAAESIQTSWEDIAAKTTAVYDHVLEVQRSA